MANDPSKFLLKRAYFRFQYAAKPKEVGGIDLNPAKLDIKDDGQDIQINVPPLDMKMFEGPGFKGLTPFIIQIVPVTNLPLLLGTKEAAEEEKLSLR